MGRRTLRSAPHRGRRSATSVGEDALEVGDLLRKVHLAAVQVMQAGSAFQVDEVRRC